MNKMQEKQVDIANFSGAVVLQAPRRAAAISAPLQGRQTRRGVELPGNSHFLAALASRRSAGGDCLDLSVRGAQLDIQLDAWNAGQYRKEVH